MDMNSINLNNNVSNDCDFSSIEIHNIPMSNTTLNNHLDSGNIATRVKAKNKKARKNTMHKKSQHFKAQNLSNTYVRLLLSHSHMNITSKGNKFTIYINVNDKCRSIQNRFLHFHRYKNFILT